MAKKKIHKYSLLECIHPIDVEINKDNTYAFEDKPNLVSFEKGKIYICVNSKHASVEISHFYDSLQDKINELMGESPEQSYDNCAEFVYESDLYDAPGVNTHFRVIADVPSGTIYSGRSSGYWRDHSYRRGERYWSTAGVGSSFEESFHKPLDSSDYYHKVIRTMVDGMPTVGCSIKVNAFEISNIKLTDLVHKARIELGYLNYYKYDLSKFKLNKNLQWLEIIVGNERHHKGPSQCEIKGLVIPRNLRVLEMRDCIMDKLPIAKHAAIKINDCHIKNLSLKNISNLLAIECTYDTYDGETLEFKWESDDRDKTITTLTIFKVEDDKFAVTGGTRFITKSELATFCATYGIKAAFKKFGLDKKTKYEFNVNGWTDSDDNNKLDFIAGGDDDDDGVTLRYKNGILEVYQYASFSWFRYRANIHIDKKGEIIATQRSIYASDGETVNDTILSRAMMLVEDERFPDGFWDDFMKACNMTTSKFIGDFTIDDFTFDMFKFPKNTAKDLTQIMNITFDSDKQQWRYSYRTHGNDQCDIRVGSINWGKQSFKLENQDTKIDMVYVNPDYEHYFDHIDSIGGLDHMYMRNHGGFVPEYDESIQYVFNVDVEQFEANGYMILDNLMYKFHTYRPGKHTFYIGGHHELMERSDIEKLAPDMKTAERLAKKYKFKLQLDHISNEKYTKIERITTSKYDRDKDEHYMATVFGCVTSNIHELMAQENPLPIKAKGFYNAITPLLNIGGELYILWDGIRKIYFDENLNIVTDEHNHNKRSFNELNKILLNANYKFSYINLVIDDRITAPIRKYILDNSIYFCSDMVRSAMFNDNEYLYRLAFYDATRYAIYGSRPWNEDRDTWDDTAKEITKKAVKKFGPGLLKYFGKTIEKIKVVAPTRNKLINVVDRITKVHEYESSLEDATNHLARGRRR